jgi:hypothetical protein
MTAPSRPSEADLRRGKRATWGAKPSPAAKILMIGPKGQRWIALPSVKQLDQDGNPAKPIWNPIIEFANRASYDKFQTIVLEALRRAHPKAFD